MFLKDASGTSNQSGESPQSERKRPSSGGRKFAIGDVHGCAVELGELLKKMDLAPEDEVIFLGDYIDRGPNSKGVIDLILQLQKHCKVICLKGNHESMFLDFLERPASKGAGLFILNGGSATLASYAASGGSFQIPREHIEFLYGLQLTHESDRYFFVHAGVPLQPLALITAEDEELLLWSREPFLSCEFNWGKVIVHGHTPVQNVETKTNRINLDTGCVYEGHLTAMDLESGEIYQIKKTKTVETSLSQLVDDARIAVRFEGRMPVKAGKAGFRAFDFETLNYNQFGLLMRETEVRSAPLLSDGDVISGQIGLDSSARDRREPVEFTGSVVRTETRGGAAVYAIRIERITDGSDGRRWIERPDSEPATESAASAPSANSEASPSSSSGSAARKLK